jgi:hypothetical protein
VQTFLKHSSPELRNFPRLFPEDWYLNGNAAALKMTLFNNVLELRHAVASLKD